MFRQVTAALKSFEAYGDDALFLRVCKYVRVRGRVRGRGSGSGRIRVHVRVRVRVRVRGTGMLERVGKAVESRDFGANCFRCEASSGGIAALCVCVCVCVCE